jgi:hypothetical protein
MIVIYATKLRSIQLFNSSFLFFNQLFLIHLSLSSDGRRIRIEVRMVRIVRMVCSNVSGTIQKSCDYFNFVAKIALPLFTSILSPDIIILTFLLSGQD